LGKNTFRTQILVFATSSGLAAVAGVFYSGWLGVSTPGVFGFTFSLTIFALVIFGGMGNLSGSMLGALVLTSLDPFLRRVVKFDQSKAFLVQVIIYGLLLVFLTRVRPQGLIPEGSTVRSILRRNKSEGRTEMTNVSETAPTFAARTAVAEVSQADRHARWEKAEVVLEARGISKSFGGIVAAENLDFVLKRGTITALVGPNGAGKTTVFNLLTGAIAPDSGTVTLLGRDVTGRTLDSSARSGLVRSFQDVRLFQRLTCLDNVLLGVQNQPGEKIRSLFANPGLVASKEKETHEQAMKWLSFVGMQDFADVPTASLSYGQTKLVSLARVLSTEAEVLLLDEPASGIDVKWVDNMLELVLAISAEGRTVCIVEHNLRVVRDLADHSYFMELGRITAEGTVDELTSSPRLAQAYFGTV
jgi:branched-chain amino acid transport system permease protein